MDRVNALQGKLFILTGRNKPVYSSFTPFSNFFSSGLEVFFLKLWLGLGDNSYLAN
jgi:hypothetical protein